MAKGSSTIPHVELMNLYYKMYLARRFEEKAAQLYGMGKIGGFCHLYIGQEAVVAGVYLSITKDDQVITSYRDHAHAIFAGTSPGDVMAELCGKKTGISNGKGGSMHIFDTQKNFYGGHGIVAAQVPIGTGLAFANKYKKNNNLCVTFLGDGAFHQGQVYESFNMASLWKLPVIYIIENNKYAMGTSVARSSATTDLHIRGDAFGIKNMQVNGMNVFEIKKVMDIACQHVRSGHGPFLIEALTYRYRGHSMSDPATYRTKTEVNEIKSNSDPIVVLYEYIINNKVASEEDIIKIQSKVNHEVNDCVEFAENSSEPDASDLYTDVYK